MTERVDRTERLLNLVICLMASRTGVPRSEIRARIPGYGDASSDQAFERMFERDKDELRSMGIPVETVTEPSGEVTGYRIRADAYALTPLHLTPAERAAVSVAAQVWSEAEIGAVPGMALRKLQMTEAGDWIPAGLLGAVAVRAGDTALLGLLSAIRQDRMVEFDYRAPSAEVAQRRIVSPWGARSSAGRWLVVGYDHDREAPRTFRVSRIRGGVRTTARKRLAPPAGFDVTSASSDPAEAPVRARVRLASRRAVALRRIAEAGQDAFTLDDLWVWTASLDELVSTVCSCGPDAVVLEPAEVVTAVRAALERILDASAS